MDYRNFEVHYCPSQCQNICVEVCSGTGKEQRRCLYQQHACRECPYTAQQAHCPTPSK